MAAKLDALLINKTLSGETENFEVLIQKYSPEVERYVHSIVQDPLDVQDILQDIWMIAYQRLDSLRDHTKFINWIYSIARNNCRAYLKGPTLEGIPEENVLTHECAHPEDEHIKREKKRQLLKAVDSLSQKLKRTVTLHYLTGYSCPEVSTTLNVPVGTVKRRLSDARKELRRIFKDWSQQSGQDSLGARSLVWITTFSYGVGSLSDQLALKIS